VAIVRGRKSNDSARNDSKKVVVAVDTAGGVKEAVRTAGVCIVGEVSGICSFIACRN